jgi:hypothetical protein
VNPGLPATTRMSRVRRASPLPDPPEATADPLKHFTAETQRHRNHRE